MFESIKGRQFKFITVGLLMVSSLYPLMHCRCENICCCYLENVCCCYSEIHNFTSPIEGPNIVGVGKTFELNCSTPEAVPAGRLTWIVNNVTIATSKHYNLSSDNELLTVINATLTDTGLYVCKVDHIAGVKEISLNVTILGVFL